MTMNYPIFDGEWLHFTEAKPGTRARRIRYRDGFGYDERDGEFLFGQDGIWYKTDPEMSIRRPYQFIPATDDPLYALRPQALQSKKAVG